MIDSILLDGIHLDAFVGVLDAEKEKKQRIRIDVQLAVDLTRPCQTDQITDTVCYYSVCQHIEVVVNQRHYLLVEHLAETIAQTLLQTFSIDCVTITIFKLDAISTVERVGVRLERSRRSAKAVSKGL